MDAQVNLLARELTQAISAAVSVDPKVEACREQARAAGYDVRVSLEAVVVFRSKDGKKTSRKAAAQAKSAPLVESGHAFEMSANDRRFLKSLRISADEPAEKEVE